jgi:hypothetical protein
MKDHSQWVNSAKAQNVWGYEFEEAIISGYTAEKDGEASENILI